MHFVNTKKVEKISEYEQRLFESGNPKLHLKGLSRVIVAAILIRGIRLFNRHIRCYMINVTIRKTQERVLSRNVSCTRSNLLITFM